MWIFMCTFNRLKQSYVSLNGAHLSAAAAVAHTRLAIVAIAVFGWVGFLGESISLPGGSSTMKIPWHHHRLPTSSSKSDSDANL